MKIPRFLGLVAVGAALITSLGVSSAIAAPTTLCKSATNIPVCVGSDQYPANTEISASTSKLEITTSFGITISCSSTLKGKTGSTTGEPLTVTLSEWTVSGCTDPSCTMSATNLPYGGSLSHTSGSDGTLSAGSGNAGEPRWNAKCSGLTCEWAIPAGTVKGGSTGQITQPETVLTKKAGFICPATATLKPVTYTINSPKPLYVGTPVLEETHARLCKKPEKPCSLENTYPFGTTLEMKSTDFTLSTSNLGNITCNDVYLKARTLALGAQPLPLEINSFYLAGCAAPCTMTVTTPPSGESNILWYTGYTGALVLGSGTKIEMKCSGTVICNFTFQNALGAVDYSKATTGFLYNKTDLKLLPGCLSSKIQLTARFDVTNLSQFYIT